jgi:hypothetical protein
MATIGACSPTLVASAMLCVSTALLCVSLLAPLERRNNVAEQSATGATAAAPSTPPLLARVVRRTAARAAPWGSSVLLATGLRVVASQRPAWQPSDGQPGPAGSECYGHGVYSPWLHECRCTAGWDGRFCRQRRLRACNREFRAADKTNRDSLCAGNCDDERGLCYCAGLATPFQRPLPHYCAPWAHRTETKLPDGRPAYPLLTSAGWVSANLHLERPTKEMPWIRDWARYYLKPFEGLYGVVPGNREIPSRGHWPPFFKSVHVGYCEPDAPKLVRRRARQLLLDCSSCYEGRAGRFCEKPKRMYCLRDCHGRGTCDSGFCWCEKGWHGVDCSLSAALVSATLAAPTTVAVAAGDGDRGGAMTSAGAAVTPSGAASPPPEMATFTQLPLGATPPARGLATPLQVDQGLIGRSAASPLRVYVYDMPSEFTTRLLQYRPSSSIGLHRAWDATNRSNFVAGSLYAMESAMHEWLLDSPLRTESADEAHLFFVPIYHSSLFMWPIAHFNDEPYYGREQRENRRRSHQGTLMLKAALQYVRRAFPFWNASNGRDHIWMMLHDEGPCFAPRELRTSILLTHYGYWAPQPRPWGTYYDDNFLADQKFYARHIGVSGGHLVCPSVAPGDPRVGAKAICGNSPCYTRRRDLVIPPWKVPTFWKKPSSALHSSQHACAHHGVLPSPQVPTFWKKPFELVPMSTSSAHRPRRGLVFFAGDLGLNRLKGYSHDLRQTAYSLFCNPHTTRMRECTPFVYGCRTELPLNCSRWEQGVTIQLHSSKYHEELMGHTFCLAFPGDGWSSRVLDAVVHGCIPVVIQDESDMFLESAFHDAGLPFDYADFSIRLAEAELPDLVKVLRAVPPAAVERMRKLVLWVRDYFIYKDMYNPSAPSRRELTSAGRPGQDAFLLITLALEARARALGKLVEPETTWRARNAALLDAQGAPWTMRRGGPRAKRNGAKRRGAKRGGAKRGGAKHSGTERGIKS